MTLLNVLCYAGLCLQHSMGNMGNFLVTLCCSLITFRSQQAFKTVENDAGSLCSSRLLYIHSFCAAKCKFLTYLLSPQPTCFCFISLKYSLISHKVAGTVMQHCIEASWTY